MIIPGAVRDRLIEDAFKSSPREVCGLFYSVHGILHYVQVQNIRMMEGQFKMNPEEQGRAFNRIWEEGGDIVGVFHSHPSTEAIMSKQDIESARWYPDLTHVILSLKGDVPEFRYWVIENGEAKEVSHV